MLHLYFNTIPFIINYYYWKKILIKFKSCFQNILIVLD